MLNQTGFPHLRSPDAAENQGTVRCCALKNGTSVEEGRRELGEAGRVRKTSLRGSDHDGWQPGKK